MLPEYAVVKKRNAKLKHTVKAVDIIYDKMLFYTKKVIPLKEKLYIAADKLEVAGQITAARELIKQLVSLDDRAVDYAVKLAPYQTPKLESMEVKTHVEHRFVMRSPAPVKNVDDWKKLTGAQELKIDQIKKEVIKSSTIAPSIHDFDDEPSGSVH